MQIGAPCVSVAAYTRISLTLLFPFAMAFISAVYCWISTQRPSIFTGEKSTALDAANLWYQIILKATLGVKF